MLYFSQQKYFPTLEEAKQQIAVLEFKENFPKEGLHWEYKDLVQFKEFVEDHLTNYLLRSFKDRKNNLSQFSPNNNEIEIPPYYREKYRKPVSTLIATMTRELLDKADKLDSDNGIDLDEKMVNTLYKSCFDNSDVYRGTDRNIPSEFVDKMKNVFEEHLKQQRENKIKTSENKKYIRNCWI